MLKVSVKTDIKFPKLNLSKQLDHIADKYIIRGLKDGIRSGVDVEGKSFPKTNQPNPTLRKTGLLLDSFKKFGARNKRIVRIKVGRRDIAKYLQIDGVGRSKKKFKFFGVTDWMEDKAIKYMNREIKKLIKRNG